jgi:hypothetical protein
LSDQRTKGRRAPEKAPTAVTATSGLRFGAVIEKKQAKVREKKRKAKNDPTLLAAARELRDRWLENLNSENAGLIGLGKYDVSRELPEVIGQTTTARLGVRRRRLLAA